MDISISYYTAVGRRQNNEDALRVMEDGNSLLAMVADGLGGHDAGEIASALAVASMERQLRGQGPDEDALVDAICQASTDIYEARQPAQIMRTTMAALWLGEGSAVAANVGDSRIYQFRDGRIIYQSMDHSVAQMAVLVGELAREDIRRSRDRNKLIRVLGDENEPKVDSRLLNVEPGDRFLLCSDGFWEPVTEERMLQTMSGCETAQQWLAQMRLIVEQTDNPLQDNHTAIALMVNAI